MKLIFLALLLAVCHARRIPPWHIRIAREQGPNACVVEELPGNKWKMWTECKYWMPRKICGQKAIIRYECCEGYYRVAGQDGCSGVKPLKNILETARDLGATEFVRYIEESGMQKDLTREGAFTLFAPTNEAFRGAARETRSRLESYRGDIENPILRYHVSERKVKSENFQADTLIPTRYNGFNLRVNKYANSMTTVNCHALVRKDQEATNGIVHLIDGVLDPALFSTRDVGDIVLNDGRFSVMARAMEESAFLNKLRSSGSPAITILAPSDEAFQKIPSSRLESILNDKEARLALLQNHVLTHPLCPSAIIDEHQMRTLSGNRLQLGCDGQGVTVEGSRMRNKVLLGNNGVVHTLDDVLIPNRAKTLLELAQSEKLFTFLELVKIGGLEDAFSKLYNYGHYTIFAPSEAAFYSLPAEVLQDMKSSQQKAQAAISFHATQGRILTNKIKDSEVVMSLDEENPLRLSVYRKAVGVECAIVEKADLEGQNGVIHIINRVISPANISAGDLLRRERNFTTFLRAMETLTLTGEDSLDLASRGGSLTFFVPTDAAFNALGRNAIENVLRDPVLLRKVVGNHIAPGLFNMASFRPELVYNLQSLFGTLSVQRSKDGVFKVNDAKVLSEDLMNTNGVIHVIDQVLMPTESDEPAEPLRG